MTRVISKTAKTEKGAMKMSQLAAASGLTVSTIKFYMSQGLLPRPRKSKPNVAFYDEAFLKRLLVIKRMRDENLSVSSIKSILEKYPFQKVEDWEDFKETAKTKEAGDLVEEERLATLSGEERRTDAILDAAYGVFSTKGYHNATVDDIAQHAGVSKGTCYQYFSGKEEIFLATLDRTLAKILTEAEDAALGAHDALTSMGLKGLTFISKFRELQFMFIGLYTEILGGNDRLKIKAAELFDTVAKFLATDIVLGIEQKVFRPVDPIAVSYAMIGIAGAVGNRYLTEDDFDVLHFFTSLMDFMQHGLAEGEPSD
ncbi:MAG: TetR family transcriptional regulator [Candidatus Geothermincolia bacterium]